MSESPTVALETASHNEGSEWVLFDCLGGSVLHLNNFPYQVVEGVWIDGNNTKLVVFRDECAPDLLVNGTAVRQSTLAQGRDYCIQAGGRLVAVRGGHQIQSWPGNVNVEDWRIFEPSTNKVLGGSPQELGRFALSNPLDRAAVAYPAGFGSAFLLHQVAGILADGGGMAGLDSSFTGEADPLANHAEGSENFPTCPVCWEKTAPGDFMHIAVDDSLRGDLILGEDARQRFHATRFDNLGRALDAMGHPCADIACPHCRRKLPPGFLDQPHHIISLVGEQSAGKSYYLSVLAKLLPAALYRNFGIHYQDADPAGNAALNQMRAVLFGAETPDKARLMKTQLNGEMYERLPRYGKEVFLPKPFIYDMRAPNRSSERGSIIFYDNAGEHFHPGRDMADEPGALHVASASGMMFLFDPFHQPEFRHRISGIPDPQFDKPPSDQQDVILAEMRARIHALRGMRMGEKTSAPLAVLAGKCDAWMHLLGDGPWADPLRDGWICLDSILDNSRRVRDLLLELCPAVVANAEALSSTVLFFPVSSFGHSPVKMPDGAIVPDPAKLKPILAEIPPLWILSQIWPALIPARSARSLQEPTPRGSSDSRQAPCPSN